MAIIQIATRHGKQTNAHIHETVRLVGCDVIYIYTCIYIYTHLCIYIHVLHMYIGMCMYTYSGTYIYICLFIYTYSLPWPHAAHNSYGVGTAFQRHAACKTTQHYVCADLPHFSWPAGHMILQHLGFVLSFDFGVSAGDALLLGPWTLDDKF